MQYSSAPTIKISEKSISLQRGLNPNFRHDEFSGIKSVPNLSLKAGFGANEGTL